MSEDARPTALRGVNLALRFALELCALAVLAYWGVHTHAGATGWLLGGAAVLAAAVLWGALVAPRRALDAPAPVRLAAELAVLAAAAAGLADAGRRTLAAALVVVWLINLGLLRAIPR